ncbi:M20/M25/M40 family metallo-hydrolase [Streptomyces litmocidini]|uniref:M20/M25/M40 family metallo-hydrolase n=1 Tax=Streptomyces litmocidini TaxID=67318 RepID=UPI00167E49C0|nr:M20/M25/M40 family metallo-hydrolase [Streptomyces litmocidini]
MRSRVYALVAVLLLVLTAVGSAILVSAVPAPVRADAAPSDFSAERARVHVPHFARAPHPSGTPEAEAVRAYVRGQLTRLGLTPVQSEATEVLPGRNSSHLAGRVHNITATIKGTSSTGGLLLVAHTDSVPTGPGASDDGLGVASLLEIARVLTEGPRPRNDVVVLLTDMEETGQLGARSYLRSLGAAAREPHVVVNLEARGTSGRAVMFETGAHSAALADALADAPPVATSLSDEVYRLLPHDTDLTPLRAAGMTGLNFAVIGGSARYHGPGDDAAHLDPGSLQDLGDTTLSAVRALSAADLREVTEAPEATWFNVGPLLVRYPAGAVLPLALLAPAALAAAAWYARRRRALRVRAVVRTALTFPLTLAAAAALGWAAWQGLLLLRPDYALFHLGDPYRTGPAVAGLLLLTATVTGLWAVWTARPARGSATEAAVGVLVWPALLAVPVAVLLPGAAYVFTWTALGGAAGLLLAVRAPQDSPWGAAALALGGLPGVAVTAPLVVLLFPTLGLASAAAPLVLAALGLAVPALLAALLLRTAPRRRVVAVGAAVAVTGTALVGANALTGRADAEHPRPVSLMYALDADRGRAYWVSEDADAHPWVTAHTGTSRTDALEAWSPALAAPPGGLLAGEAPVAPVSRPEVTTVSDTRSGATRTVRLSVKAANGTPVLLALYVDTSATEVVGARLNDAPAGTQDLPGGENRPHAGSPWKWGLLFAAPSPGGHEVTLTVRGGKPLRVLVMTQDAGLPERALRRPRPEDLTWLPDAAGLSFASRVHTV